jgi:hypothetical protein
MSTGGWGFEGLRVVGWLDVGKVIFLTSQAVSLSIQLAIEATPPAGQMRPLQRDSYRLQRSPPVGDLAVGVVVFSLSSSIQMFGCRNDRDNESAPLALYPLSV